jgi:hypothetical protein
MDPLVLQTSYGWSKGLMRACLMLLVPLLLLGKTEKRRGWESSELIWNGAIISLCDRGVDLDPGQFYKHEDSHYLERESYEDIQKGEVVWVSPKKVFQFFKEVFPKVRESFILLVSGGDESFPSQTGLSLEELNRILEDKRLIHIFAQNCDYEKAHKKLTPIPIGLDYHTIAYKGSKGNRKVSPAMQEKQLLDICHSSPPLSMRKKKAFIDFHHFDSIRRGYLKRYSELGEDRTSIFNQLKKTGLIDAGPKMERSALWKVKSQYAFSISPHGNGLDCHRTWEDLALGCIVIVKTSPLDRLYEGLPVVIVKDWAEIKEENLNLWLEQFKDFSYREKLTLKYWLNKIDEVK